MYALLLHLAISYVLSQYNYICRSVCFSYNTNVGTVFKNSLGTSLSLSFTLYIYMFTNASEVNPTHIQIL